MKIKMEIETEKDVNKLEIIVGYTDGTSDNINKTNLKQEDNIVVKRKEQPILQSQNNSSGANKVQQSYQTSQQQTSQDSTYTSPSTTQSSTQVYNNSMFGGSF